MQIEISTTQELRFVMYMAAQSEGKNLSHAATTSFVRLFFVGNAETKTPATTFEDAMKSLNEAGVHLMAELIGSPPTKTKKKARKAEKKKA